MPPAISSLELSFSLIPTHESSSLHPRHLSPSSPNTFQASCLRSPFPSPRQKPLQHSSDPDSNTRLSFKTRHSTYLTFPPFYLRSNLSSSQRPQAGSRGPTCSLLVGEVRLCERVNFSSRLSPTGLADLPYQDRPLRLVSALRGVPRTPFDSELLVFER